MKIEIVPIVEERKSKQELQSIKSAIVVPETEITNLEDIFARFLMMEVEDGAASADTIRNYLSPSRWVINFHDWALDAEHDDPKKPKGKPYAADYPDCLKIVEEKVKPERDKNKNKQRREIWWRFTRPTIELYEAIAGRDRVLVRSRVADIHSIAFVPANIVLNERLTVFAFSQYQDFVLLQSNIHEVWARRYSGKLRKDMMYAPRDCFETFPFPARNEG